MLHKKRLHFWQLSGIFGAITVISILISWGLRSNTGMNSGMMAQSMSSMMTMHLKNVTVADLIRQEEHTETAAGSSYTAHHEQSGGFLQTTHILTTGSIIILLPLIIAGSVFLFIVWMS